MEKVKSVTAVFAVMVVLAGCANNSGNNAGSAAPAPGRATLGQVESACVTRLAETANVAGSDISVTDSTGSSEGTAVFLSLNGAPWVCRADGAGNITALDFQGEG